MISTIIHITGILAIVLGVIFIIKPTMLVRISEVGNKAVLHEKAFLGKPRIIGLALLVISVYIFIVLYQYY